MTQGRGEATGEFARLVAQRQEQHGRRRDVGRHRTNPRVELGDVGEVDAVRETAPGAGIMRAPEAGFERGQLALAPLVRQPHVLVHKLGAPQRLLEHVAQRTHQRAVGLLDEVAPSPREPTEAEHECGRGAVDAAQEPPVQAVGEDDQHREVWEIGRPAQDVHVRASSRRAPRGRAAGAWGQTNTTTQVEEAAGGRNSRTCTARGREREGGGRRIAKAGTKRGARRSIPR